MSENNEESRPDDDRENERQEVQESAEDNEGGATDEPRGVNDGEREVRFVSISSTSETNEMKRQSP